MKSISIGEVGKPPRSGRRNEPKPKSSKAEDIVPQTEPPSEDRTPDADSRDSEPETQGDQAEETTLELEPSFEVSEALPGPEGAGEEDEEALELEPSLEVSEALPGPEGAGEEDEEALELEPSLEVSEALPEPPPPPPVPAARQEASKDDEPKPLFASAVGSDTSEASGALDVISELTQAAGVGAVEVTSAEEDEGRTSQPDIEIIEEAEEGSSERMAPSGTVPPPIPPASAAASMASAYLPEEDEAKRKRKKRKRMDWWVEIFDDAYLRSLPRYTERDTRIEVDFIEGCLGLEKGGLALDLACGQGRHAVAMAERGYRLVGLDVSLPMLARAADLAQEKNQRINFMHGDIRELTFNQMFDAVYCVGTSFGFFDDETNEKVIQGVHRALKPQGLFLLEVANRDFIINTQPNLIWFEGDGCTCMEETDFNFISSRLHVKRTILMDEDGRQVEQEFSIRLYALHELGRLLHDNHFRVAEVSGHFASPGAFFGADSAKMMILAERRG